jgi:beta-aspartyl-dipeptidase (metallo-type)
MNFGNKGRIAVGMDADLLVFDQENKIEHVMALGQWHMWSKSMIKKGTFEV